MVEELHHAYGTFDPVHLQIHSRLSKVHTDAPATSDISEDGAIGWMTMVHEFTHFAQFASTTFGLLVTLTRLRQRRAFMIACRRLAEQMKSRGDRPVLYAPFIRAIEQGLYPDDLSENLTEEFLPEWTRAENNLCSNFGVWPEGFDEPQHASVPPGLVSRLSRSLAFVNEPFTVAHVMEPVAVALHSAWAFRNLDEARAQAILSRINPTDPEYLAFPAIEHDLGVDLETQLMLHDMALMLPVQPIQAAVSEEQQMRMLLAGVTDLSAPAPVTPAGWSPPARLLAMLEVLEAGAVPAWDGTGSRAERYTRVSRIMAKELGWPDPRANVAEALQAARERREHFKNTGLALIFEDFIRAYEIRRTRPDAFYWGSESSIELHNAGWQPIWVHPEGFAHADGQSSEESTQRLRVMLESRANRSLVVGDEGWECPLAVGCGRSSDSKTQFFARTSESPGCECSFAVELATGGAFEAEDIVTIP